MKTWPKTGILILAMCCMAVLTGCNLAVDRINVRDIRLSTDNLVVQSGAPKILTASIEPYFAADLGILFVKEDPDNLILLSNQTQLENPWEYSVTVSTSATQNGTAKITAISLDGSKKAAVPVSIVLMEYALTVRNLNSETLNTDTTANGELATWQGGVNTGAVTLTNKEDGAQYEWKDNPGICFEKSTIAYLAHKDDGNAFTGDFTFRAKLKFEATGITGSGAGFFFGVFKDPTVDPAVAYTGGNANTNKRFRVEGIRVIGSGTNVGTVRRYFTSNGGSSANPRYETPSPAVPNLVANTEYTFEVTWDGVSMYTNKIIFQNGTEYSWDVKAGLGNNNIHPDLTDPNSFYYPAIYAAGVKVTLTELTIIE
jgi:hypothetical protein